MPHNESIVGQPLLVCPGKWCHTSCKFGSHVASASCSSDSNALDHSSWFRHQRSGVAGRKLCK
eukprot:5722436-Amphidinium_carterae.1